jgi:hypothetical protein
MDEQKSAEQKLDDRRIEERREFLKKAGKAAITAPAVALLLNAASKPAYAQVPSGPRG